MANSAPECPVSDAERQWLEARLAWLCDSFGIDRLLDATVVLPNDEFFPDRFDGTAEDARVLLDAVCQFMGYSPGKVELLFFQDRAPPIEGARGSAAGMYEEGPDKHRVWVEVSNLHDPLALVATMAHEVGHILLLGQGRVSTDEEDHEPLTDLLTVFLGLGVMTANAVIRENYYHAGAVSGWSMSRRGYLSMQQYGYALAWFALRRGERKPAWAHNLRADVRQAFDKALICLQAGAAVVAHRLSPAESTAPNSRPAGMEHGDEQVVGEVEEGAIVCASCGETMAEVRMFQGRTCCKECRESIIDNERQLEAERDIPDTARLAGFDFARVFALFVGFVVLLILFAGLMQGC